MAEIFDLYTKLETFKLDDRFSEPIRTFYYNFRSLLKYWTLTRDLVATEITQHSHIFSEDDVSDDTNMGDVANADMVMLDGEEMEHDFEAVPFMQRNLVVCTSLSLIEALLKNVCAEVDPNYQLNGKGSYIQQYQHFIRQHMAVRISKNQMKCFETFGHVRNSFMHQLNHQSVPAKSVEYINTLTGPFSDLKAGLNNTHVELLLQTLNEFGNDFQSQYWADFESRAMLR